MAVATAKGAKGFADILFARIVRARSYGCERCRTEKATQTAHIIGRGYSATRCDEYNAWNLCGSCHATVDSFFDEKMALVERTITMPYYHKLRDKAQAGIGTWNSKLFWANEVKRLQARCVELGLDTRRRIPG